MEFEPGMHLAKSRDVRCLLRSLRLIRAPLLACAASAALATTAGALAACTYSRHEGVLANGANSELYFASTSDLVSPSAVGARRTFGVARYSATTVDCHRMGTAHAATGGTIEPRGFTFPPDSCAERSPDPITLLSASCDSDACVVVPEAVAGGIALHVEGKIAGATRLLVSVKAADGTVYQDSLEISFAIAARIRLAALESALVAMRLPALPGLEVAMPRAWLVDASGHALVLDEGALESTVEGTAYVPSSASPSSVIATVPGHTTLRWRVPSLIERTLDLEVVAPSEARALFVYATPPTSDAPLEGDPADSTADPGTAGGRVTSLQTAADSYLTTTFPVRVSLADGRVALAPVASVQVAPATLAKALPGLNSVTEIDLYDGVVGSGTATIRVDGAPTLTIPVTVSAH
jgi:hypothetical protein